MLSRLLSSSSILILITLAGCAHQSSATPSFALRNSSTTYANGLRLVVYETPRAKQATVVMSYAMGAPDQPVGKDGLVNMAARLRSASRPGGAQAPTLKQLSLDLKALTYVAGGYDLTTFHTPLPAQNLAQFLTLEAQQMREPLANVTEADFVRERDETTNELREKEVTGSNSPLVKWILRGLLPGHPYGRSHIGDPESLRGLSLEDVRGFVKNHYTAANAVLVVTGPVTSAEVKAAVERAFATAEAAEGSPRTPPAPNPPPPLPQEPSRPSALPVVPKPVKSPYLVMLWTVPSVYEDYHAVFADGPLELAFERRLRFNYEERVSKLLVTSLKLQGATLIIAAVGLKKAEDAQIVADTVLGGALPQQSLNHWMEVRVRTSLSSKLDETSDSIRAIARMDEFPATAIAQHVHFTGEADLAAWEFPRVQAITEASMTAYLRKYLRPEQARLMLFVPQ